MLQPPRRILLVLLRHRIRQRHRVRIMLVSCHKGTSACGDRARVLMAVLGRHHISWDCHRRCTRKQLVMHGTIYQPNSHRPTSRRARRTRFWQHQDWRRRHALASKKNGRQSFERHSSRRRPATSQAMCAWWRRKTLFVDYHNRRGPEQNAQSSSAAGSTASMAPASQENSSEFLSPPPPDSSDHPVCEDAVTEHPVVKFPPPPAKVRLPPPGSVEREQQALGAIGSTPPSTSRSANWQDKFNGLFGRTLSRRANAIDPALISFIATSKPAEDELVEDRHFGSVPTTKIPTGVIYKNRPEMFRPSAYDPSTNPFFGIERHNAFAHSRPELFAERYINSIVFNFPGGQSKSLPFSKGNLELWPRPWSQPGLCSWIWGWKETRTAHDTSRAGSSAQRIPSAQRCDADANASASTSVNVRDRAGSCAWQEAYCAQAEQEGCAVRNYSDATCSCDRECGESRKRLGRRGKQEVLRMQASERGSRQKAERLQPAPMLTCDRRDSVATEKEYTHFAKCQFVNLVNMDMPCLLAALAILADNVELQDA
ncbi:hypothetical protein MRB53_037787 [Persea americana]|nr:hypothetical protein MRB53_037787 [Persea americana]